VPDFIADTIENSVPFFLKAETLQDSPDSLLIYFDRFEYLLTDSSHLFFKADEIPAFAFQQLSAGNVGVDFPFSNWVNSVIFLLLLFCFMTFAFVFRREGVALMSNFKNLLTLGKIPASVRKNQVTTTEVWGELFMILQAVLLITIILFTFLWDRGISSFSSAGYLYSFAGFFFGISFLTGLKFLMYRFISTFFMRDEIKSWITRYSRLIELFGLIFFFPAVFYVFLPEFRYFVGIFIIVLFFINRIIIVLELLNIFVKNKIGYFYFFVYLCGTEIAPCLMAYKGVVSIISIAGNYIV